MTKRRFGAFFVALALGGALVVPRSAGANLLGTTFETIIQIRNDAPNPAYVLVDFLAIPNVKAGKMLEAHGGFLEASNISDLAFLTQVHIYVKPEGQPSESAPTVCYAGGSFVNSSYSYISGGVGTFKFAIEFDAQKRTCWLKNVG